MDLAVKWIGWCLHATKDKGLILHPSGKSLDLFVDSDFAGNWDKEVAELDSSTAHSCAGFVLMCCSCPLLWSSNLITEIMLSMTESEFVALSMGIHLTVNLIEILREMQDLSFPIASSTARAHCKVFEDNSGALEIAAAPKC